MKTPPRNNAPALAGMSQPKIGMLKRHGIAAPQARHRERGRATDSPSGIRMMQTLRKLPMHAPAANTHTGKNQGAAALILSMACCMAAVVRNGDGADERRQSRPVRARDAIANQCNILCYSP